MQYFTSLQTGVPPLLNIEHVPAETGRRHRGISDEDLQEGHDTLAGVARAAKEAFPDSPVGYFDMIPPQHMQAWDPDHELYPDHIETIRRAGYRVDPDTGQIDESDGLLDHVDFLAPAFYLPRGRLERYRQDKAAGVPFEENYGVIMLRDWIRETAAAARTSGKPVYAVLWAKEWGNDLFDDDGFCAQPYVGDEIFAFMIETSLEYCDGVILWSRHERYDPEAPFLDVLASFTQQPQAE